LMHLLVFYKDTMFPLFLNLLRNFLNAHGRSFHTPTPNVISRVTTVVKAINGSGRKKQEVN
jgi:hypothetical protein